MLERTYIAGVDVCFKRNSVTIGHVFPSGHDNLWAITDTSGRCYGTTYTSQWGAALQLQLSLGAICEVCDAPLNDGKLHIVDNDIELCSHVKGF